MAEQLDAVDFALAAYLDDDEWVLDELAHDHLDSVSSIVHALRRLPGDEGAIAMVAVDEDFFVIVRVDGDRARVLLSDVTAADEWELAESAVRFAGLPSVPDLAELEDDDPAPAGDLALLDDLGLPAIEMAALLDDYLDDDDAYPEEVLSDIARELGFGEIFDDAVGLASA